MSIFNRLQSFVDPRTEEAARAVEQGVPLFGFAKTANSPQRKETLNSKNTGGRVQRRSGAASKKPVETEEQKTDKAIDQSINEAAAETKVALDGFTNQTSDLASKMKEISKRIAASPGSSAKLSEYASLLPSPDEAALAGLAGQITTRAATDPKQEIDDRNMNNLLMQETMQAYLDKKNHPYAGVDLENLSALTNQLFGSNLKMKNVPAPTIELNNVVGMKNAIQKKNQEDKKEVLDIVKNFQKPYIATQYGFENKPLKPSGGQTARGVATDEKYVHASWTKLSDEHLKKDQQLAFITDALQRGGQLDLRSALSSIAKGIGSDVGNIAIREADNYLPSTLKGDWLKFVNYIEGTPNAETDPNIKKAMDVFVKSAMRNWEIKKAEQKRRLNESFNNTNSYKNINERIAPVYLKESPNNTQAAPAAPTGRLAELLKKAGGK